MRRNLLASVVALTLLGACATAPEPPEQSGAPAGATSVSTVDGASGTYLVDGDGRTLYLFTLDGPGVSACDGACLVTWPALLADGEVAVGGSADAALLGTLVRADGSVQVTYAGQPLYTYAGDAAAGDVNGQGVDDVWFLVAPDGSMIGGDGMGGSMSPSDGGYGY